MSTAPLQLSVATPVVTMLPGVSAGWEQTAPIEDLAQIAEAADQFGYHHLTCSEHIALPAPQHERRGTRYWDPLATLGYLAARTRRIRLATHVLVRGYHHPLEIAKRHGRHTLRSLRRVTALADGWAPFNVSLVQVREWLSRIEIRAGLELIPPPPAPLDPIDKREQTRETLADMTAHGVTIVAAAFTHTSLQHYLDNRYALAEFHPNAGGAT
jgi:hypothetical protein